MATQGGTLAVRAAAAGAVSLLLLSDVALAQDGDLEDILVTGSRIARPDFEAPSPIVTLPAAAFEQTAAVSVERTLNTLPQFAASATGTSNNPANDGQANVSLRGIGVAQTLVLLDGRRLMPADGRGSPDLNVLPPALISGVEIVTGGASAAYGSDAIAGVVNFKLKDEFEGVQVDGQWAETGQGDGQDYTVGLTAGTSFAAGRGAVMGYVGYTERDQVNQGDRSFSRYPLQYFPDEKNGIGPRNAFIAAGSTIIEAGNSILFSNPAVFEKIFASYGYAPGTVPYQAALSVNPDGTVAANGDGTPGSVTNVRREQDPAMVNDRYYTYNLAPTTALQMPLERTSVFMRGTFEFAPETEGYVQALYSDYTVNRQLAPVDAGIMLIPTTNPYIPADLRTLLASRANPAAPFRFFKRITEIGPRVAQNDRELLQLTAGVQGRVYDDWQYELYAQFGHNDRTEKQTGNVLISRFEDLSFAADGGRSICGEFNPFQVGTISPQCADYISVTGSHQATVDQTLAEATISGPLLTLPAGELRTAFGVFYKDDEFRFKPAEGLSAYLPEVPGVIGARPDLTGFPSAPARSGSQSNTDLYVEALAPVLRDAPGVHSLELGLGYRYSDYSIAGNADSYKAELMYRPVQPVLLRGSFQHAVRAPSIDELYYPQLSNQFLVPRPDPCSVNSDQRRGPHKASVEALCLAQGLPPALLPTYAFDLRRVNGVSGGNPQLEAEQADTSTFGIVLTSPFDHAALRHLQVSLDWYSIDLQDAIGRWDSESAVKRCYDATYNPGFEANNIYCTFFTRDATSGEIFARIIDSNIGGVDTSGVDLQVDWSMEAGPGLVGANFYLTHVQTWKYSDPSGGTIEYAGTIGGGVSRALPEWKSLLSLSYGWRDVQLFARWQYIDGMTDAVYRNSPLYPDFEVPSRNYLDLGASITFAQGALEGLTARVGVDNATDTDPPVFPSYTQANTDPSVYDVLGRRYYVSLGYHF